MARRATIPKFQQYHPWLCRYLASFVFSWLVAIKSGCAKLLHHSFSFRAPLNFWALHWLYWWREHPLGVPTSCSSWSSLSSDKGSRSPVQPHRLRRASPPFQRGPRAFPSSQGSSGTCSPAWCLDSPSGMAGALHWKSAFSLQKISQTITYGRHSLS